MFTSVYQEDRKMNADQMLFYQDSAVSGREFIAMKHVDKPRTVGLVVFSVLAPTA